MLRSLAGRVLFLPPPRADVPVHCPVSAPLVPRGRPFRVLVWNIQYGAGRTQHFFYDGGTGVSVPKGDVDRTLARVGQIARDLAPDVVLWQEVDRGSRRTQHIDELPVLQAAVGLPCHGSTPYHRAPYVPYPPHEHLGRVDMHLAFSSRFRVAQAIRWGLAPLAERPWRRIFNLRRALLELRLPVEGGGELVLFDTHLSAFSRRDGTVPRQVDALCRRIDEIEREGRPWLLAGDFNALPPGDDPHRLPDGEDYDLVSPLEPLFARWRSVVPAEELRARPELGTYVPWGAAAPDRAIDHVFVGGPLAVRRYEVRQGHGDVSDHLPLVIDLELG